MKTPSIKTRRLPTASKVVALLLAAVGLTPPSSAAEPGIMPINFNINGGLSTNSRYGANLNLYSAGCLLVGVGTGIAEDMKTLNSPFHYNTGRVTVETAAGNFNIYGGSTIAFTLGGISLYDTTSNTIITGGAQICTWDTLARPNTYSHIYTENGINFPTAGIVNLRIIFEPAMFVGEIGTILELGYDLISFGAGYTLTEDILGKFNFTFALNEGASFAPHSGVEALQAMYYDADGASTLNFAEARGVRLAVTAYVPEPTTATLGILGLAGLLLHRRRTNKQE